jgi:hypothetical protein
MSLRFFRRVCGEENEQHRRNNFLMSITPTQCRAARALLDLTRPQLAAAACLGLSTVVDFERSRRAVSDAAIAALRATLDASGVEFTNGDQPGVRLRKGRSKEN